MAKVTSKPVEIEEEDLDLEMEDLEIADVEVEEVEEETDEIEAELEETTKKADKKADKPKGEGLTSTKALADDEVGAAYVAELCGVDSRELRAFLRKNYRNMDEAKSQRYSWKKNDPQIQEVVDAFKAAKSGKKPETKPVAKAEAKAEVAKAPAKVQATPAVTKQTVPTAKTVAKK